ncbi:hypothetical protein J4526_08795 [Desulfurococcaceae archaeon MEX13E-LK6-19]|nr:hypothetical protein J4526_08795 [Desulfurococcaceae archaeon MEX13E-LK6-19]
MYSKMYKLLLSIALTFLFLDIFSLLFLKPGTASFVACIIGVILLIIFIIIITIDYYWQTKKGI